MRRGRRPRPGDQDPGVDRGSRANQPSAYYSVLPLSVEYLDLPNHVVEDVDPDPVVVAELSVLDTLLRFQGGALTTLQTGASSAPAMTYYHGVNGPPFVFSGHDLWSWTRQDGIHLVDFVLQEIWGLPRAPVDRVPGVAPAFPRTARLAPGPSGPRRLSLPASGSR